MAYKDKEKSKEYGRKHYQENKERLDVAHRKWNQDNPEKRKQHYKTYKQKHKEEIKEYYQKNIIKIKKRLKEYRQRPENKKRMKAYSRIWRQENLEKERVRQRNSHRKRTLIKVDGFCQFDGCGIDNPYILDTHHLFPEDKEIVIILCVNHHRMIDHFEEGFFPGSNI